MRYLTLPALLLVLAYGAWPFASLWYLDNALRANHGTALEQWVDLPAIRSEIKNRLNKDVDSTVGEVSNSFIDWLQQGIRRMGAEAVDTLVTMDWVRQSLLSKSPQDAPAMLSHVSYAFFDAPSGFLVRVGELGDEPVHLRMTLQGLRWRVSAVYH